LSEIYNGTQERIANGAFVLNRHVHPGISPNDFTSNAIHGLTPQGISKGQVL